MKLIISIPVVVLVSFLVVRFVQRCLDRRRWNRRSERHPYVTKGD